MHSKRQFDTAKENYDLCLKSPNLSASIRARTHLMRGFANLRSKNKNLDAAEADIQTALDMNVLTETKKANAYLHLGIINRNKEKYDAAIQYADKAIELKPTKYNGYFSRARSHYKARNLDEAIADYSKAIQLSPEKGTLLNEGLMPISKKVNFKPALRIFRKRLI
jgi:tetratricopeptide (TPR) repeat protein